jgi:hypothetical protein
MATKVSQLSGGNEADVSWILWQFLTRTSGHLQVGKARTDVDHRAADQGQPTVGLNKNDTRCTTATVAAEVDRLISISTPAADGALFTEDEAVGDDL